MAIDFDTGYETSTGPLDVAKVAGGDNVAPPSAPPTNGDDDKPLDAAFDPPKEEELLRKKNPLGYSITPPTEREIDLDEADNPAAISPS